MGFSIGMTIDHYEQRNNWHAYECINDGSYYKYGGANTWECSLCIHGIVGDSPTSPENRSLDSR